MIHKILFRVHHFSRHFFADALKSLRCAKVRTQSDFTLKCLGVHGKASGKKMSGEVVHPEFASR